LLRASSGIGSLVCLLNPMPLHTFANPQKDGLLNF
jgi:hypothetical protein